jgi:putative membrane protein
MVRLFAVLVLSLLANALGLLAANFLLDDFSINFGSFITAVLIFSIATTVLGPLITKIALTSAPYLIGGIALVTTLVGLIATDFVSGGIALSGLGTWIAATVIVWLFSLIGNLLLPLIIFKKALQRAKKSAS